MATVSTERCVRVLVLANGRRPGRRLWKVLMSGAADVFCVDGGANTAARLGAVPAAVFGDMDSVQRGTRTALAAAEWTPTPDQDRTDLDKALELIIERGYRQISVAGAFGGRVDHTVANLGLLRKYLHRAAITFHARREDVFALEGEWRSELIAAQRVSILPVFGRVRVWTEGLHWMLNGEELETGLRDSVSNQAIGGPVHVECREGPALVVVQRKERVLFAPDDRP